MYVFLGDGIASAVRIKNIKFILKPFILLYYIE